jgi:transcription elongation factor Elf1
MGKIDPADYVPPPATESCPQCRREGRLSATLSKRDSVTKREWLLCLSCGNKFERGDR